jgi:tetratricopeptide (TPR) repeat protein
VEPAARRSLWVLQAAVPRRADVDTVLAYRPEELLAGSAAAEAVAQARTNSNLIDLGPFEIEDIARLSVDDALTRVLAAATDRTPLAVSEVLRTLAAEDAIRPAAARRWRLRTPRTLDRAREIAAAGQRAAIVARAATRQPPERELMNLLALVAREVPARALALATRATERDVLDRLETLSRNGLARLGEQGWATSHDMVADALVEQLSRGQLGRLHAQLAQALSVLDAEPGELARHWHGAGDTAREAASYRAAATRALDAFADTEAAALATAGLQVAPSPGLSGALYEVRAQARARLGDITGARDDLREALQLHQRGPLRAQLLGRLAALASGADDLIRAAELAELALIEAGDDPAARAHALEINAVLDMNLDRAERAEVRAAEALALYQQLSDANGSARILDSRAMATFLNGNIKDGTILLDRAANLFEDSGDLVHVITPRSTAGHGLVFADLAEQGLQKTTSALELARTIGHAEGQTYALWHTTEALAALHRGDEALDTAGEALAIATRIRHRGWTATAWRAVGIAHQARGDPDKALHAFQSSLANSEHLNLFASWAAARSALVLIELGHLAAADSMIHIALKQGPPLGHYEGRLAQVELAAARADPDTTTLAETALAAADAGGVHQDRSRLWSHLARPH